MWAHRDTMFDRVVVHVITAAVKVVLIAHDVFPKPLLPDTAIFLPRPRDRLRSFRPTFPKPSTREPPFDRRDSIREIRITGRQRKDQMHVIRQQHRRHQFKRPIAPRQCHRFPQHSPSDGTIKEISSPVCDQREKKRSAGLVSSSVVRHGVMIPKKMVGMNPTLQGYHGPPPSQYQSVMI